MTWECNGASRSDGRTADRMPLSPAYKEQNTHTVWRVILGFIIGCVFALVGVVVIGLFSLDLGVSLKENKDAFTSLGALSAAIGLMVASVALAINAAAQRQSAHTATWTSSRDCLWHFTNRWNELGDTRKLAYETLKKMSPPAPNEQLSVMLNFFDNLAFMGNHGHLDDELAWSNFFDEGLDLWKRAEDYIRWQQKEDKDPTLWCEFGPWIQRLDKINVSELKRAERLAKRSLHITSSSSSAAPGRLSEAATETPAGAVQEPIVPAPAGSGAAIQTSTVETASRSDLEQSNRIPGQSPEVKGQIGGASEAGPSGSPQDTKATTTDDHLHES
jgi:hypothetical protein